MDKVNPLDVSAAAIGSGSAMNSGAKSTTNANDLIFGAAGSTASVTQVGTGFTSRSTSYANRTEDKKVTTTGSYNATATQNGSAWVMHMVAFRADAGTPDTTAPSIPTGLTATSTSSSQINLAWTASTDNFGVTGYKIFRAGTQVGTSTTPSFPDTGLTPNTTYSYTVSAFDAAGNNSAQSATATATTKPPPDTTPPSVPTGLTASAVSTSQINLSWNPSSDNVSVAGYKVFRNGTQVGTPGTTLYQDTGLAGGTTYNYTVSAVDGAGNASGQSLGASATTLTPPLDTTPPTVTLTAPTAGATVQGQVALSADASDDTAVLGVQFLLDGANFGTEDPTAPYSLNWDTTSIPNGTHMVAARARDGASNLTTTPPISVTVNNPAVPSGLAAGYAFDEASGTTATDASGHGLTGTLTNGPGHVPGRYGNAVNFDGTNDYVDLGNPAGLQLTGSVTISAWVYSSTFPGDDAPIVSKRGTGELGYQLDTTVDTGPRTIGFKLTNNSGTNMFRYGATALQANTWYHVAGVYNATAGTLDVYLNGVLDNGSLVGTVTTSQQNSTVNVNIGQRPSGGYSFNGLIDDVRIHNRALTAGENQTAMNAPLGSTGSSDPTPPSVLIDSPANNSQVSGIVTVTADAADNIGVAGVQFFVDGVATGLEDSTDPYGLTWDSRTATNGAHTLTARARDAAGNIATSAPVVVNVANNNFFQNDILATGFNLPTAMKFLPDGRLLIAQLAGLIRVVPPPYTTPDPTPFLQITNIGSAGVQQGIYDFAFDPNFATNHFYYVFYTLGSPNHDRLSRFTANASNTGTVAGSEFVLYEDPQNANAEHHGGAIMFGNDGKLYFTTGEHFDAAAAQDLNSPRGKIHRINFDGTVPTDNPFYDGAGPHVDSIWAYGLRNPYRGYYDAPTGRMYIGDVGGNDYSTAVEEVNLGARGANYGWPNFQGNCSAPCTSPLYSYPHNGRDSAVTGGFVYHGNTFPAGYDGRYFFADYTQNWIRDMSFDASGNLTGVLNFEPTDGSVDGPYGDIVYLIEGPDGNLYYLDLGYSDISGSFGVSKLRRISYVSSNQAPVVAASANPTSGAAPLDVTFSSAGSSDPEGHALTYLWTFGDNTTSTAANPVHTYTQAGTYSARLAVSDSVNTANSTPITISVGNRPAAAITSPTDGAFFLAGDVISYSGNATDTEDGVLPASAYTWNIDFLHEGHVHPGTPVTGVKSGTFTIPTTGHDFSGNTRYRITLTVTDSNGLTDTKTVIIWPTKVNLTFNTAPTGQTLYLDGIAKVAPFVYDTLVGFNHTIEARNASSGGNNYTFASWSDGGTQIHVVVVPSSAQSYTATYTVTPIVAPIAFVQVNSATPQSSLSAVSAPYS
ncbi:MAG TPA: PQQ-dependent sugar dehydrogenase, partial [Ilumatobacteraceae bacterium]|nr:PQQ-dependent sugar dehydrogenase [Ilumatobacteraceae bacterium]